MARQYHVENGQPERVNFIARLQSYHGNTIGGAYFVVLQMTVYIRA